MNIKYKIITVSKDYFFSSLSSYLFMPEQFSDTQTVQVENTITAFWLNPLLKQKGRAYRWLILRQLGHLWLNKTRRFLSSDYSEFGFVGINVFLEFFRKTFKTFRSDIWNYIWNKISVGEFCITEKILKVYFITPPFWKEKAFSNLLIIQYS